jgi:hypothetical protein
MTDAFKYGRRSVAVGEIYPKLRDGIENGSVGALLAAPRFR